MIAPIARMSMGESITLPSCIDRAASDGCISFVRAYWPELRTDHAAIVAFAKVGKASSPQFLSKTWRCKDA